MSLLYVPCYKYIRRQKERPIEHGIPCSGSGSTKENDDRHFEWRSNQKCVFHERRFVDLNPVLRALTRNDCQQVSYDCHAKNERTRKNGKAHQSPIIINRLFFKKNEEK